jgi:hypothetical protein
MSFINGNAESILREKAKEMGWSVAYLLELVCEFIDHQGDPDAFEEFVLTRAEEEQDEVDDEPDDDELDEDDDDE